MTHKLQIKINPDAKTVGQASLEALQVDEGPVTIIDKQREMQQDYLVNLIECINTFKQAHPHKNFFVVVLAKNERLLTNVVRNYFMARLSCPTPNYDQTVYQYFAHTESLNFIWVIPDRDTCFHLKENVLQVHPEEHDLLKFIFAFSDGTLYNYCKYLNGELDDAPKLATPTYKEIV